MDELHGLKENVIVGHLIPAGTGLAEHRDIEMVKLAATEAVSQKENKEKDSEEEKVEA